jgi:hypothetical protein
MSKYGDVIRQARQTENQQALNPQNENETSEKQPEDQLAEKPANQISGKPLSQQDGKPDERVEEVNLSIKVPKTLRRHWVSEAKRADTTITAVIIEALKNRFGTPPEV